MIVPFNKGGARGPSRPSSPLLGRPTPEYLLMAAAQMNQMDRLFESKPNKGPGDGPADQQ